MKMKRKQSEQAVEQQQANESADSKDKRASQARNSIEAANQRAEQRASLIRASIQDPHNQSQHDTADVQDGPSENPSDMLDDKDMNINEDEENESETNQIGDLEFGGFQQTMLNSVSVPQYIVRLNSNANQNQYNTIISLIQLIAQYKVMSVDTFKDAFK